MSKKEKRQETGNLKLNTMIFTFTINVNKNHSGEAEREEKINLLENSIK